MGGVLSECIAAARQVKVLLESNGYSKRPTPVVNTPHFTRCATPEHAAAYAGLVPVPDRRGTGVRGRPAIGRGGNGRPRTALSMATLRAARRNPAITPFADRLRATGTPTKVARCVAARTPLPRAWAVDTTQRPFDPRYQQQHAPPTARAV